MIELLSAIKKFSNIDILTVFIPQKKHQLKSKMLKEKLDFALTQQDRSKDI